VIPNGPISPDAALERYFPLLTAYEQSEILSFPEIYFLGNRSQKLEVCSSRRRNFGFDNADHTFRVQVGDHFAYRFEVIGAFGSGAFGQVVRAIDHKTRTNVALKVIVNTPQMHDQGQVEAAVLARLNQLSCPHIVRAMDFFVFRSHICLTIEILGRNLYELSKASGFKPMPVKLVRRHAAQILTALRGCQECGVVHCDLKPENVLVADDTNLNVKLIDFGSSCFNGHQKYEYVQSRFYRAPEVVLGLPYGPPMDMWSCALVLIEMLIGRPLFQANDELELLAMIAEVCGTPPVGLVATGKRRTEFFDGHLNLKPSKGATRRPFSVNLQRVLQTNDIHLVDFMTRCLTWDQALRMTVHQALEHPWIKTTEVLIPEKPATVLPPVKTGV
jgi:dual specificity tyrosine-phosphorylation-regulated kinase 2/3/4